MTVRASLLNLTGAPYVLPAYRARGLVVFQNKDDQALFRELGLLHADARTEIVDGSGVDIDHYGPCPAPAARRS